MRNLLLALTLVSGCAVATSHPINVNSARLITEIGAVKQQTSYPTQEPIDGPGHLKDFDKLMFLAHALGVEVVVGSDLDAKGYWGLFTENPHRIYLNPYLTNQGAVEVLAHELAHVLTPMLRPPDDDIVAQGVAYIVCHHFGIDDTDDTISYYFWLTGDFSKAQSLILKHSKDIDKTASFILDHLPKDK